MTQKSVADYQTAGDSKSLKEIDGQSFIIVAVENSNYDETPGVKITVKNPVKVDGVEYNKFHTTRHAVVKFFSDEVRHDLESGETIGPVKCVKTPAKTKGVADYWVLQDC